jgi:hypothetical protein
LRCSRCPGVLTIVAQVCTIAAMKLAPVAVVALITLCTPLVVFPIELFLPRQRRRHQCAHAGRRRRSR